MITTMEEQNSSDEDYNEEVIDEDTCTTKELENLFRVKHRILVEEKISNKKDYVLNISSDKSLSKISAGLSNGTVKIFNVSSDGTTISESAQFYPTSLAESSQICGLHFLNDKTANELIVGYVNGNISLYDLRTNKVEYNLQENSDEKKPISCLSINSNNRIVCAGTEKILQDAFLLFFDLRQRKLLGGYLDSHTDDITTVAFHKQNPDKLMSGSTDGLINIFDISKSNEDDALLTTINTENSVEKLNWHENVFGKELISCITHTNDLLICDSEESEIVAEFNRAKVTESIKRKLVDDCNLINCHNTEYNSILLLASSNYNKGNTMRSLKVVNKNLIPHSQFEDNKQIVRDSIFNQNKNVLVTCGESGIITLWGSEESQFEVNSSSKLKIKSKLSEKQHRKKPYE